MSFSFGDMYGSLPIPGRKWVPRIEVSGPNVGMVPPEELITDPYLQGVYVDPFDPASTVVIPSGRFVSVGYSSNRGLGNTGYRFRLTDSGMTSLTIHDGLYLTPCGMSVNQMYRQTNQFNLESNTVRFRRGFVAEVPYIPGVNDAYGTPNAGDKVTGYFGSTTALNPTFLHRGKPVKWLAKNVYVVSASASANVVLSAANLPGIVPVVVAAYAAGTLITTVSSTVTWNGTNWVANFTGTGSSTVTSVMYEFGQDADQIAGEILRIQSTSDTLSRDNFLKWVEYAPLDYLNFPPPMYRYPVTTVGTGNSPTYANDWEAPSAVVANSTYQLNHAPLSVFNTVQIAIQGSFYDLNGNLQTYSGTNWYILPFNSPIDNYGYFIGQYHNLNWLTGLLELSSNIFNVTAIYVQYSYLTDPRQGAAAWGTGVLNLTDGSNVSINGSPAYGLPSNLNIAGVTAALRVIVKE